MSLAYYRESLDKQREGAPISLAGITFYVRRWGTPESQAFLKDLNKKLFGPFHSAQQSDQDLIYSEWLCGYGVVNWAECLDADTGCKVEYSTSAARGIFTNQEYFLSLNREIISAALSHENYLMEEAKDDTEELKKK